MPAANFEISKTTEAFVAGQQAFWAGRPRSYSAPATPGTTGDDSISETWLCGWDAAAQQAAFLLATHDPILRKLDTIRLALTQANAALNGVKFKKTTPGQFKLQNSARHLIAEALDILTEKKYDA